MRIVVADNRPSPPGSYVLLGGPPRLSELIDRLLATAAEHGITLSRELATRIAEKGEREVGVWIEQAQMSSDFRRIKRKFVDGIKVTPRNPPPGGTVEDYEAKAREQAERHAAAILAAANQAAAERAATIQADANRAAAERAATIQADVNRAAAERAASDRAARLSDSTGTASTGDGLSSMLGNPVVLGALGIGAFLFLKK